MVTVAEQNVIKEKAMFDIFAKMFKAAGGNLNKVDKVFAINNPRLKTVFEAYRESMQQKHQDTAGLFKRDNWKSLNHNTERKAYLEHFSSKVQMFREANWNDGSKVICYDWIFFIPFSH